MKLLISDHRNALKIIPAGVQEEVKAAILSAPSVETAAHARDGILAALRNKHGWSDEVKLSADAKISITSRKGDLGLCLQTGNMGRFYADVLKLEYLYHEKLIHAAVYILPDGSLAKSWNQNIAHYERFVKEIGIFSKIVHTPLLIIGISRK
jgi:hypothetical protein